MFLDASAIVAIVGGEPEARHLANKIEMAVTPICYSSLSVYEAIMSFARKKRGETLGGQLPIPAHLIDQSQELIERFLIEVDAQEVPIDMAMHRVAIKASRDYGRAVAHPARLNFGDCFAYACAKVHNIPLLYKGDDFPSTDIESA
jgi:ribonuclease VapC